MNDRERITRLEIRCEQLQLTVNEAFHWIDILKSDLSDLQDRVGQADRKTENSSEKPNNCEDWQDWKDRMWAEAIVTEPTTEDCSMVDKDINVRSKDEPQTSKIIEAYAKGYKDGADAAKGIKDKQIRACDICKYEIGETCTHPKVKTMKKEWATFEGDLWGEENTPKWCPIDKDEPQTDCPWK